MAIIGVTSHQTRATETAGAIRNVPVRIFSDPDSHSGGWSVRSATGHRPSEMHRLSARRGKTVHSQRRISRGSLRQVTRGLMRSPPESPDQQSRGSTTHMHTQPALTALDIEIQDFAQTLNQCFRGVSWDVVNYYAAHAWSVSDRSDARWPEVRARVRSAWEAGVIGPVFRPLEMAPYFDRRA